MNCNGSARGGGFCFALLFVIYHKLKTGITDDGTALSSLVMFYVSKSEINLHNLPDLSKKKTRKM